jgi:hypothetical protein
MVPTPRLKRPRQLGWHRAALLWLASCTPLEDGNVPEEASAMPAPDAVAVLSGDAGDSSVEQSASPVGTGMNAAGAGMDASVPFPGDVSPGSARGDAATQPTAPVAPGAQGDASPLPGSCAASGTCPADSGSGSLPSTPTCTANLTCTPSDPCKTGRTSCASGVSSCVQAGDVGDGAPCNGGVCSKGQCCPAGQSWTGSTCAVVCAASQRLCGSACVAPEAACNGACPSGRVLCSGQCTVGDCCSDAECGRCMKCSNHQCTSQSASEDLKQDCYEGPCDTGFCDGRGSCGHLAAGTVYCEVTRLITCSGGESFTDMQCANNCLPSCKPTSSSCRGPATCNECQPGLGFTKCASSTSLSECGSNGRWLPGVACSSGQVCSGNDVTARCSSP